MDAQLCAEHGAGQSGDQTPQCLAAKALCALAYVGRAQRTPCEEGHQKC